MRRGILALGVVLMACGGAAPTTTPPTTMATTSTGGALDGVWEGLLGDGTAQYQARITLDGCVDPGQVCGQLEYGRPEEPAVVLCASELIVEGVTADRLRLTERMVYHPWECLPTTVVVSADGSSVVVEQSVDGTVCCVGSLLPSTAFHALPDPIALPAIGIARAVADLGGASTQYAAASTGSIWMPLEDRGLVARLDASTGAMVATILTGDPEAETDLHSDPHAVAGGDGIMWVAQASARSLAGIDPATGVITAVVALPVTPYALAVDGDTLWVTSFLEDTLVAVDSGSGAVLATIAVPSPTGVAIGDGSVWVVLHRNDRVVRIDPATGVLVADIAIGSGRGENPVCGRCVENVVFAFGAVWTADNWGRTVSRIDPATNAVTSIDLPGRPWSVTAGGGYLWASLIAEGDAGAITRIDPATGEVVVAEMPVLGVFWGEDALWAITPGRRGDVVWRIEPSNS